MTGIELKAQIKDLRPRDTKLFDLMYIHPSSYMLEGKTIMPAFIPLKRCCCFFLAVLWLFTTYGKSGDFDPDDYDVYCDDGNRLAVPRS
ncbi:hypothetical protein MUK42_36037 [Musa troglodytarum]|uniref:Uncharacterized protein n=1 Tax=Musa troglodytarum TaxID=320322 RepID=A0A9E7JAT2_9LILI|nr:hypothetical protein MUK42_36037 [Musa troglodytarum]